MGISKNTVSIFDIKKRQSIPSRITFSEDLMEQVNALSSELIPTSVIILESGQNIGYMTADEEVPGQIQVRVAGSEKVSECSSLTFRTEENGMTVAVLS